MSLNKVDREECRKNLILKMKKSEIVNHFKKEGYPRQTVYDSINRFEKEGTS